MKTIFLGATKFSEIILKFLIENEVNIQAVFYIPEYFNISYSDKRVRNFNYGNIRTVAESNGKKVYEVDSVPGKKLLNYKNIITELKPDVILVMGWYYMVPKKIRNIAKHGAWGIHASLLPNYAGGAPLVWAMINGEEKTGVSLFKLDNGVDDGDIIMQKSFAINYEDSIADVYNKATEISKQIIVGALNNIDNIRYTPQNKSKLAIYPQRKPEDGEIDLSKPSNELYNFIRAQSNPYPGAFIRTVDGEKLIIEKARIE